MAQGFPTWYDMLTDAVTSLDDAQQDIDVALERMNSDRPDRHGPDVDANRE